MEPRIVEEPIVALADHAAVPIAFEVTRVLAVSTPESGLGGMTLTEVPVGSPWVKDYDAVEGNDPSAWAGRFDVSDWALLAAYHDDERVGGAVLAPGTDRRRGATVWDLRVRPGSRAMGVGSALFAAAERWCLDHRYGALWVETQNVNVAACRLYAAMGCELRSIDRDAYPAFPDETRLVWRKDLGRRPPEDPGPE